MADENAGRDKQSMGASRSLASSYPTTISYGGVGIQRGTGADWFGPLNPMNPSAPPQVKGRILDFPSGYNLSQRPKAYEPVTFEVLRNLADGYDLLRIIIETRKDQMSRLKWNIVPRAHAKKKSKQPEMIEAIEQIERFFVRPDGTHFWADWLRLVLEDLLVLDAPAIYRRRTYGGSLYALEPIDGSTIKRVIDDWGRTPQYPVTAYQQVLKGLPALDYTTRDLIYRPRNLRTHKVYGFSPVEQILMTVNIGMRRQVWQLQSFTEGTIPEALIGTPSTWTPDQIRAFQDYFDSLLQGNTGERRRARFVPGELAKGYVATKPSELFGEAEEWLIRVVCFAFGVSAQPFVKMMNRATAETAQESAAEEGLAPIQNWVKGLMDSIILDDFENEDLEFEWLDEDELDPKTKSEILDKETGNGTLTLNEARAEKGLDPYDHPDANRPMYRGAQGYTPIFKTHEEQAQADAMKEQLLGAAGAKPGDGEVSEDAEEEGKGAPPPPAIQIPPAMVKAYNEDQERDDNGRFASGGAGDVTMDESGTPSSGPDAIYDKGAFAALTDAQKDEVVRAIGTQHVTRVRTAEEVAERQPGVVDLSTSAGRFEAENIAIHQSNAAKAREHMYIERAAKGLTEKESIKVYNEKFDQLDKDRKDGYKAGLKAAKDADKSMVKAYNEDQERDDNGRFAGGGAGDVKMDESGTPSSGPDAIYDKDAFAALTDAQKEQVIKDIGNKHVTRVRTAEEVVERQPGVADLSTAVGRFEAENIALNQSNAAKAREYSYIQRAANGLSNKESVKLYNEKFEELDKDRKDAYKDGLKAAKEADKSMGKALQEGGTEAPVPFGRALAKAGAVKGSKVYVDPDRDDAVLAVKSLKRTIAKTLRRAANGIAEQVRAKLSELGKADTPEDPIDIDDVLNSLDIVFFNDDADDIAEDLESVFRTAGTAALAQVGSQAITNEVNDRAVEWAREHAAELAGLTDNEDYSLDSATRAMLRGTIVKGLTDNIGADAIAEAIKETYAFSDERAELIAMTEIASANSLGALAGYEEAQRSGVRLGKSWLILEDACEICHENEDAGVIELDEAFPSGDLAPPAHPNCRCVLVPEVDGEEQDPEETMELMAKALLPRDVSGRFNTDPGKTFLGGMVTGIPGVKAKAGHKFTALVQDEADGDLDTDPLGKVHNLDAMSSHFPVDASLRDPIWAMGGSEAATAERLAALQVFVPFDQCVATQDYCDEDKVTLYMENPTAKGFAPTAHKIGDVYAIQDGHHRAVASKLRGLAGMEMNVIEKS